LAELSEWRAIVRAMRLTPVRKGFSYAVGTIAAITAILTFAFARGFGASPYPSPELFRQLAQAGIGLLIAYSIAVAAAERSLGDRSGLDHHLEWLGFVTGIGVCGLVGIGLSFGIAEHREAGHENLADQLGFWWTVASVGLLGLVVALQPMTSYEWRKLPEKRRWRSERLKTQK
jgi:hypothetical protein